MKCNSHLTFSTWMVIWLHIRQYWRNFSAMNPCHIGEASCSGGKPFRAIAHWYLPLSAKRTGTKEDKGSTMMLATVVMLYWPHLNIAQGICTTQGGTKIDSIYNDYKLSASHIKSFILAKCCGTSAPSHHIIHASFTHPHFWFLSWLWSYVPEDMLHFKNLKLQLSILVIMMVFLQESNIKFLACIKVSLLEGRCITDTANPTSSPMTTKPTVNSLVIWTK